jgi:peroxiredoxin
LVDSAGVLHELDDALGFGPVVLTFFKADCQACNLTFPYLENLHQAYAGAAWTIWGVCQHPARAADWFAKNTGVTFPLLIDGEGYPASNAYDPPATPTVYLVGRDRKVLTKNLGMTKDYLNELSEHLAELIGRDPVVIAPPDDGKPSFRPG